MELSDGNTIGARRPLVELLLLALPTVAQMASYTLMQFADRWMLARVGEVPAAAAGTAGITFFCVLGFGFGVLLVINTFVSQAMGRGDLKSTGASMWQGVWFGAGFGMLSLCLIPLAQRIFLAMGHEPLVAATEATYFQIVTLGGSVKLVTIAISQFLLGLHRPTIVFLGTVVGIFANVLFNWMLIYGNLGFPAMGIAGAAWGTNAAVTCELLVMGLFVMRKAFVHQHGLGQWRVQWDKMRLLLKIGIPAGFQLICDITAWMIFMNVIVGSFGTAALTANSFAFTYMHVCFMPAVGVGTAVTALVGKYIGMGRPDMARRRAHLGFGVCAVYMVAAGLILYAFRFRLIGLFTQNPETIQIGAHIMLFVALYQIFDALFVVYVSALRGAGDTLVPAVVQAILVWTIVVGGGAWVVHFAPDYGIVGPWALATVFGSILGIFMFWRFSRGRWESIRLHGHTAGASDEPLPVPPV